MERVESMVGKGKNAGYQHFLLFPQCFQKASFSRLLKVGIPHSSVGRVTDLRSVGRWFTPRLGKYSFRGLMIVIDTGFVPVSPLGFVSTMVMWDGLKGIMCGVLVKRTPGKHG